MERSPIESKVKISRNVIFRVIVVVALIGIILFMVETQAGRDYTWIALFIILFNLYLLYRISIRWAIAGSPTSVDEYLKQHGIETNHEEGYKGYIQRIERQYENCTKCQAKMIPGLDYCEECGNSVKT